MTRPHRIERNAHNRAHLHRHGAALVPTVLNNLNDNLPGYPASSGARGPINAISSPVETAVIAGRTERALTDWQRLVDLDHLLDQLTREWADILARWSYTATDPQAHHAKLARTTATDDWCTSCLRVHQCASRHRGDLCKWCDDFKRAEGQLPPLELLEAHHRGVRITSAMVRQSKIRRTRTR